MRTSSCFLRLQSLVHGSQARRSGLVRVWSLALPLIAFGTLPLTSQISGGQNPRGDCGDFHGLIFKSFDTYLGRSPRPSEAATLEAMNCTAVQPALNDGSFFRAMLRQNPNELSEDARRAILAAGGTMLTPAVLRQAEKSMMASPRLYTGLVEALKAQPVQNKKDSTQSQQHQASAAQQYKAHEIEPYQAQPIQPSQAVQPYQAQAIQPYHAQAVQPYQAQSIQPYNAQAIQPYQAQAIQPYHAQSVQPYQAQTIQPYHAQAVKPGSAQAVTRSPAQPGSAPLRDQRTAFNLSMFFHTYGLAVPGVAYTVDNYAADTRTVYTSTGTVTKSAVRINPDHTYDWNSSWDGRLIHGHWTVQGEGILLIKGQQGLNWLLRFKDNPGASAKVTLWDQTAIWYDGTPLK